MQEMSSPRGKASYLHNVRIIVIATLAVTLCYPALINTAAVRSEKQLQQFLLRDSSGRAPDSQSGEPGSSPLEHTGIYFQKLRPPCEKNSQMGKTGLRLSEETLNRWSKYYTAISTMPGCCGLITRTSEFKTIMKPLRGGQGPIWAVAPLMMMIVYKFLTHGFFMEYSTLRACGLWAAHPRAAL